MTGMKSDLDHSISIADTIVTSSLQSSQKPKGTTKVGQMPSQDKSNTNEIVERQRDTMKVGPLLNFIKRT